jgi:hypothetical protein
MRELEASLQQFVEFLLKATARRSSGNATTTSIVHGRYLAVWIQLPALCSASRLATSEV